MAAGGSHASTATFLTANLIHPSSFSNLKQPFSFPFATTRRGGLPLCFSVVSKISTIISVADKLPDATISYLDASDELQTVSVMELTAKKKAILMIVPGAFTPTCFQKHLPRFVEKTAEFMAKGVDTIAYISFNDAFVMKAWKKDLKIGGKVLLNDGNNNFTRAIGCELDLNDKPSGLGVRLRRYALYVKDGVVRILNLEDGGAFNVSSTFF